MDNGNGQYGQNPYPQQGWPQQPQQPQMPQQGGWPQQPPPGYAQPQQLAPQGPPPGYGQAQPQQPPQGYAPPPMPQMPPMPQQGSVQMGADGFAFSEDMVELTPDIGEGRYDFEVNFKELKVDHSKKTGKDYRNLVYQFTVQGGQHDGKKLSKRFSVEFTAELRKLLEACSTTLVSRQAADGKREGFSPRMLDGKRVSAEVYFRDGQYIDLKEFKAIETQPPQMQQPQAPQQQQQQQQQQMQPPPGGYVPPSGGWQ